MDTETELTGDDLRTALRALGLDPNDPLTVRTFARACGVTEGALACLLGYGRELSESEEAKVRAGLERVGGER